MFGKGERGKWEPFYFIVRTASPGPLSPEPGSLCLLPFSWNGQYGPLKHLFLSAGHVFQYKDIVPEAGFKCQISRNESVKDRWSAPNGPALLASRSQLSAGEKIA